MTQTDRAALRTRIEALTPEERARLAQGLRDRGAKLQAGGPQLVAFFKPAEGHGVGRTELNAFARERLPEHMVPNVFIPLEDMPRAPGGKVDRQILMDRPWTMELPSKPEPSASVAPRNAREETLAGIWCQVLRLDSVGVHEDYFELGGDSLLSIRILARARKAGLHISPEVFFARPTVAQQAEAAEGPGPAADTGGPVAGSVPLTPIQHWFFDRITADPQHWNESLLFEIDAAVGFAHLEAALAALLRQHDALRLRFRHDKDGWAQSVELPQPLAIRRLNLVTTTPEERDQEIDAVAAELNAGFDLATGNLVAFAVFESAEGRADRLLIVAHHLVIDAVSWHILLEDLETACGQVLRGQTVALPEATMSFKHWAEVQAGRASEQDLASDIDYWERHVPDDAVRLPLDFQSDPGVNSLAGLAGASFRLDSEATRVLLQDLPRRFRAQITDALLTALARSITTWSGRQDLIVDLEGHGRDAAYDDLDLSRTVGWLTTVLPMRLALTGAEDPVARLQCVKEQLRRLPGKGAGHGRLAYLAKDIPLSRRLRAAPRAQVCFNYLGQGGLRQDDGALVRFLRGRCGLTRSLRGPRAYLLEVNARVDDGCLVAEWFYHQRFHTAETIESLGRRFLSELRALIAAAQDSAAVKAIPSDFPLADLDEGELSRLGQLLGADDRSPAD